jgi:hypothetical protein
VPPRGGAHGDEIPHSVPNLQSPPEAETIPDLDAIEDALRQLELVPYALWSPALRDEYDALVERAACMLLELHALGLIRFVRTADGPIEAELLDRTQH